MAEKNISASVLARLRNQANQENLNYQLCLQLFVQEEFLRRLSRSPYYACKIEVSHQPAANP